MGADSVRPPPTSTMGSCESGRDECCAPVREAEEGWQDILVAAPLSAMERGRAAVSRCRFRAKRGGRGACEFFACRRSPVRKPALTAGIGAADAWRCWQESNTAIGSVMRYPNARIDALLRLLCEAGSLGQRSGCQCSEIVALVMRSAGIGLVARCLSTAPLMSGVAKSLLGGSNATTHAHKQILFMLKGRDQGFCVGDRWNDVKLSSNNTSCTAI